MNSSLQITFRHMDVSPAAEERIRDEASKLDRYFDQITSCRVLAEAPHRHHLRGQRFRISIDLSVPGSEFVVKHEPSLHSTLAQAGATETTKQLEAQPDHKDIYVSVRDAFAAARRRLERLCPAAARRLKDHAARDRTPNAD